MNILLTGSRAPVALDLSRRFHQAGHSVFQADSLKLAMANMSNSVTRSFHVPKPVQSPQAYIDALLRIVDQHHIDWLIPTCEEVFYIAAHRAKFNCQVLVDDLAKLKQIHNKWLFSQSFGNEFAAAPETILLNPSNGCGIPEGESTENWVFKPVYSRFASRTLVGPSPESLRRAQSTWRDSWIAQRRIRGDEFSTYSIAHQGQLSAHVTYRSLYRAGRGAGIYFEPVKSEAIKAFTRQFAEAANFTGQIGFDLMRDAAGRFWVLEGNPRATSGAQLFGGNDPLCEALTGTRSDLLRPALDQCSMVEFAMPIWGLRDAIRQGMLASYVRDLFRARWLNFSWRDPLPILCLPLSLCELIAIAWRENRSLQAASTFDIEWNGESM